MSELECFEHQTGAEPVATVIWLHGLGADGHDFEPVVPLMDLGPRRPLRFVFPNAPLRPVTLNAGMVMRAWYDMAGLEPGQVQDEAGLNATAAAVEALIARELGRGIPSRRVFLAGFSQGGASALYTALRYSQRLAGVLGLSCYLPVADRLLQELSPANRDLPVFMAHGESDPVLPYELGLASRDALAGAGYAIDWHSYRMPHSVTPEELDDIRQFLDRQLGPAVT